jgi:hypothetical protein
MGFGVWMGWFVRAEMGADVCKRTSEFLYIDAGDGVVEVECISITCERGYWVCCTLCINGCWMQELASLCKQAMVLSRDAVQIVWIKD